MVAIRKEVKFHQPHPTIESYGCRPRIQSRLCREQVWPAGEFLEVRKCRERTGEEAGQSRGEMNILKGAALKEFLPGARDHSTLRTQGSAQRVSVDIDTQGSSADSGQGKCQASC